MGGLAATLTSCDPSIEYQQVVENNTEYDIWLRVHDSYPHDEVYVDQYEQDSFFVAAKSEVVLYQIERIGKTSDYANCFLYADSITTRVADHDTLFVSGNLSDTYSWEFNDYGRNSAGKCECRYTINAADIEIKVVSQP